MYTDDYGEVKARQHATENITQWRFYIFFFITIIVISFFSVRVFPITRKINK